MILVKLWAGPDNEGRPSHTGRMLPDLLSPDLWILLKLDTMLAQTVQNAIQVLLCTHHWAGLSEARKKCMLISVGAMYSSPAS